MCNQRGFCGESDWEMLGTPWAGRCSLLGGLAPPSCISWALPSQVACPGGDRELCAGDAFVVGRLSLQHQLRVNIDCPLFPPGGMPKTGDWCLVFREGG